MKRLLQNGIVVSRWLMAPFYFGLAVMLAVLLVTFLRELARVVMHIGSLGEHDAIIALLSLVDMTLAGSLVIIVVFSGYESMCARITRGQAGEWPTWLATVDFSGLKRKLFGAMAAISGVALLKALMKLDAGYIGEPTLLWLVVISAFFLVGYLLMAIADRIIEPPSDPEA